MSMKDIPALIAKQVTMINPPIEAEWKLPKKLERVYRDEDNNRMVFIFDKGYYQVYGLVDLLEYDGTPLGKSLDYETLTICFEDLNLLVDAELLDKKTFNDWVVFQKEQYHEMKHEGLDVLHLFRPLFNVE